MQIQEKTRKMILALGLGVLAPLSLCLSPDQAFGQTPALKLLEQSGFASFKDDRVVAVLRWLHDQDVALVHAQKQSTDAEQDRVLMVLRDHNRGQVEEILKDHRGILPPDLQGFAARASAQATVSND